MRTQISLFLILPLCFSCSSRLPRTYKPASEKSHKYNLSSKFIIGDFSDQRSGESSSYTGLFLIPLIPYGKATFVKPDEYTTDINVPIKYYLYHILKSEINQRYPGASVLVSETPSQGFDYKVSGILHKYECRKRTFSYGLSFMGVWIWVLGAPIFTLDCEVSIEGSVSDKSGKMLIRKKYSHDELQYNGVYYGDPSDSHIQTPIVLQRFVTELLQDFEASLQRN